MQKWILSLLMVALLATPALAFKDVPPNHWAYDAINKAVEAGILQGYNNLFHGKKTLNRFQMAVVVARMLDKVGTGGGGVDKDALKQLEALVTEFADELALLNVKVGKLEETVANHHKGGKKACCGSCKTGCKAKAMGAPGGVHLADGKLKIGGIFKHAYIIQDRDVNGQNANAWDYESFRLVNARLLFWHKFTDDIKLFVQTEHAKGLALSSIRELGNDIKDVRVDIKLPNSENMFSFGRWLPPITRYMHRNITTLDFITYPIAVGKLGNYVGGAANGRMWGGGQGVWRQSGMMFTFGEDTKFKLGIFNGADNGTNVNVLAGIAGIPAPGFVVGVSDNTGLGSDDEEKAIMLAVDFKGTDKWDAGAWYWSDEDQGDPNAGGGARLPVEFDAMGLWFSYKFSNFDFLFEYMDMDWGAALGVNTTTEADSMMLQFIVPMQKDKTDFLLRIEQVDADGNGIVGGAGTNQDIGDHDRMTVGFRWKMHDRCHWQIEYWKDEFNGGNSNLAGNFGNEPSTIFTQLMVWF